MKCWLGTSVSTPSRSRITMYRPRSSCTQPKFSLLVPVVPVKLMTSPGFMDLSSNSTKPDTKLLAMACRPNPNPRPMAPVNRPSTVRSTPEALMPSNTPRPTRKNVENLVMPMRVEIARPSSFMTRRSMVRAIRLVATRKPTMTTMLLSNAQSVKVALPGRRSMPSSVRSTPANQPRTWKEMIAQSANVSLSSQARIQLFGPSETLNTCSAKRTSTSTVVRSMAMSMSAVGRSKVANSTRRPRTSTTPSSDGARTMPAITKRRGQRDRSSRVASGRSQFLM